MEITGKVKEGGQASCIAYSMALVIFFIRTIKTIVGLSLLLVGAVGVTVCLVAIVDPVGAKMADDNDPFGDPPSRNLSFAWAIGFGVVGACGIDLLARRLNT